MMWMFMLACATGNVLLISAGWFLHRSYHSYRQAYEERKAGKS